MLSKIQKALELGKLKGAKVLLGEYYQSINTNTESKNCPSCNVLDGQDDECEVCNGVGSIDVILPLTQEELEAKVTEYLAPILAKQKSDEALEYLASTDWYITRHIECDVVVPQDVLDARAKAREDV